jgi:hypothetical protein
LCNFQRQFRPEPYLCLARTVFEAASVGEDVMKSAFQRRLARWGTGAIALLVFHGFCAPRSAWAGCNHLVGSQSDPMLNLSRLDDLVAGGRAHGQPAPERRQSPCEGMSCSSPTPLPVSTANPLPERSDQWGAVGERVVVPDTSLPERRTDDCAPRGSVEKTSVFHPPRV